MSMFNKKVKEEIKTLINTIEYCHIYLAMLELMQDRLVVDDTTNKIAEIEVLLSNTRQRLRELGVY